MNLLKTSLLLLFTLTSYSIFGQTNAFNLELNKVKTRINDRGSLFNNPNTSGAGYEVPKDLGNHLIYQGAFWFGGTNQNNELKLASYLYGSAFDFYAGPYSSTGDYNESAYQNQYSNSIWGVSRTDIINHINNYDEPGYVIPDGILNWPGNGADSLGVASQLAPYMDVDSNGVYEPELGDYPCVKGDMAVYQIMHEDLAHNNSGGEKIGAEIHIMAYQYLMPNYADYLNATTFVEATVYNRGQNSFDNFKASFFIDSDIGFSEDDYIGSAPAKNMMYAYNGYDQDAGQGSGPGYASNTPTVGVVSLNKEMAYAGTFYRSDLGSPFNIDPSTATEYWNYMNGNWLDGNDWTQGGDGYGGANPTHHLYDGNPNQGTGWTELNTDGNGTANTPGDRRMLVTSVEESFTPGDHLTYNYAIVTSRVGDHLENVEGLLEIADSVQMFFDTTNTICSLPDGNVGLSEEFKNGSFNIYPNPTKSQLKIVWGSTAIDKINVISYQGRVVQSIPVKADEESKIIDVSGFTAGVYFVKVGSWTRKLIVE